MSCYFCAHWHELELGAATYHRRLEEKSGLCKLQRETLPTSGDHHCSNAVYRTAHNGRSLLHDMMCQRDSFAKDYRDERTKRLSLEKLNKELRKKLKEATQ